MTSKVALCFLTYDNLSQPSLWKGFINPKYNIYIHNKTSFKGIFAKYCIKNRVETKWGHMSLVHATLNLFKKAYETSDNEYFVLLSDKCIPLYTEEYIYNTINKWNNNIILSYKMNPERFNTFQDKTFFDEDNFVKQHQWMVLNRTTVKFFIENDYTPIFGNTFNVPDEHYFINIMQKFSIPFTNKQVTYVNWEEDSDLQKYRKRPKTYSHLTNDMIENIKKSGCLFMRKVGPECTGLSIQNPNIKSKIGMVVL